MKKIALGILIAFTVLAISGVATAALMIPAAEKAKEKAAAVEQSPVISGDWALSTPGLEKIEFIHWKKGFAKPPCDGDGICEPELGENPSCADCKNGGEEPAPAPTCYAFIGQYGKKLLKWGKLSVSYVINPGGFSTPFVTGAISTGAEEWDVNTGAELFNNNYKISTGPETSYKVQNYVNAISFTDYYSNPDIIGAATIWYNPATKEIVEFDIVFETDYSWGNCLGNEATCKNNGVMDLQNIATHELGHGVGLADVYETECNEMTMYGYSYYGETKKRTLEMPDITGIQKLYGGF